MAIDEVTISEGWEERLQAVQEAQAVVVHIEVKDEDSSLLTDEESERLAPKLNMVARAAQKLAYNMIKGTLKYSRDSWSIDTWVEMGMDDATDTLNYFYLLKEAISNERESLSSGTD